MQTILFIFLGASLGSFLGVVIDRFPERSFVFPGSHCNHCQHSLSWWELIPILSQLFLRSKCRSCQNKIPYWYLGLEVISAILTLLLVYQVISVLQATLLFAGFVLTIYDIKHQEYPLMVWFAFTFLALLFSHLNWIFCLFICLAILAEKYPLHIGSGDFFYLASLSLLFSFSDILFIIQIASISGLLIFAIFKPKSLPFVPYLFFASLIVQCF